MAHFNCWMCRHPNVSQCTDNIIIDSILGTENRKLECPICYEEFDHNNIFFTDCKHYACIECVDNIKKKLNRSSSTRFIMNDNNIIEIYNIIINNINNNNIIN